MECDSDRKNEVQIWNLYSHHKWNDSFVTVAKENVHVIQKRELSLHLL